MRARPGCHEEAMIPTLRPRGDSVTSRGWRGSSKLSQVPSANMPRSEEHTSELQSLRHLVCRLLLEKKKKINEQKRTSRPMGSARAHRQMRNQHGTGGLLKVG